jgi:hypothetical protein
MTYKKSDLINIKAREFKESINKLNFRLVYLVVITLNLIYVALPQGLRTLIGGISIPNTSSLQEVRNAWGAGDAGSLLDASITWAQLQNLNPETQFWIVRLWSPGLSIIEVPLIWLTKIGIPIFWSLLSVTIILWVFNFKFVFSMLKSRNELFLGFIVILVLINSWDFQYILREGLFYTEGLGYGLLFLGLMQISKILASEDVLKIKKKKKLIAGALIGGSIWIRHTHDTALILTIIIFCIFLVFSNTRLELKRLVNQKKFSQMHQERKKRIPFQTGIKSVIVIFLIALVVTIPWRVIAYEIFGGTKYSMSSASQYVGPGLWVEKSEEAKSYWVPFGINWACRIDAEQCKRINDLGTDSFENSKLLELGIKSALTYPGAYIQERFSTLTKFWISNFPNSSNKFKIGSILPLLYFLIIPLKNRGKWNSRMTTIASIWIIFIIVTAAQLAIIHFESRYFIPIRLLLIGLFFSLIQSIQEPELKKKKNARY